MNPETANFQDLRLRLIETKGADHGHYTALSYCWGESQSLVLTSATLDSMLRHISFQALPQTFKDAVVICIRLGLRNLWIDALCILQDSEKDWYTESVKMANVFGNSLLTIKASGASNTQGGCFQPRNTTNFAPAKMRCWAPGVPDAEHALIIFQEVTTEREPLETRAWALQEELLSPRTLSYGTKEMSWECNTAMSSDGGRQVIETHKFKGLPKPLRTTRPTQFPGYFEEKTAIVRAYWRYILDEYNARCLTYPDDRLPALSGIAETFHANLVGDKYYAGLWKSSIPWNLLWHMVNPAPELTGDDLAPSWSWAAIGNIEAGNRLLFNDLVEQVPSLCRFVSAEVDATGTAYGRVRVGLLHLEAPLIRAWRVLPAKSPMGGQKLYLTQDGYEKDLRSEREEKAHWRADPRLGTQTSWTIAREEYSKCYMDRTMRQDRDVAVEAWLLFIHRDEGIILEAVNTGNHATRERSSDPHCFRRVGVFGEGKQLKFGNYEQWFSSRRKRVTLV